MRLFFIGWAESCSELVDAAYELQKNGHAIVYWVRNEDPVPVDHSRFPNTAFHSYHEARNSIPSPEIPCDQFAYPDKKLLEHLAPTELLVLPMMNKIYPGMSVSLRRHIFIQFIRYWLGVIDRFKPELIFFHNIPHAPLYYALFGLATHLGIKTKMIDLTWVSSRITWMDDYREGSLLLRRNYELLKKDNQKIEDLPEDLRKHYERHRDPAVDTTPAYLTSGIVAYSFFGRATRKVKNFLFSLFQPKIFFTKARRFYISMPNTIRKISYYFRYNLRKAYRSFSIEPDLSRKFVYMPLHLQPECTTNPVGEVFQDQIFLLQTLSQSLPKDWVIYVKEHPFQWPYYGEGFTEDRYRSYYSRIAKIPQVFLISMGTHSLRLIEKAQVVATVSGTAGWEAILRGKSAFIFGNAWYQYAPGVFRVRNAEDCRNAFDFIQNGFSISQNDTLSFLQALGKSSIAGYIDDSTKNASNLKPKENKENFLALLLSIVAESTT